MAKKYREVAEFTIVTPPNKVIRDAEVTNYLTRLSNYHYKLEVVEELKVLAQRRKNLSNIFVLSDSFKVDQAYAFMGDIPLSDKRIYSLLNIGTPISILPNETIFRLNAAYSILNYIYEKIKNKNLTGQKKNWFKNNYSRFLSGRFNTSLRTYRDHPMLSGFGLKRRAPIESFLENWKSRYEGLKPFFGKEYSKFSDDELNSFSKQFFRQIQQLHRPVVGIFQNGEFSIINSDYIRKGEHPEAFFEIRSLQRHSPVSINITGLGSLFTDWLYSERYKLELKKKEKEISEKDRDIAIKDLEILDRLISLSEKLSTSPKRVSHYQNRVDDLIESLLDQLSEEIKGRSLSLNSQTELEISEVNKVDYKV